MKFKRPISRVYGIIFSTLLFSLAIYSLNVASTRGYARSDDENLSSDYVNPRQDIVLSVILDSQLYSETICANFKDTIAGDNAPWQLKLDKFGECASTANPPSPPTELTQWVVRIVQEQGSWVADICRPRNLEKPGVETCYGEFTLPPSEILTKILTVNKDYVALLMGGLLEGAPITATTNNNVPPGKRENRFPASVARSTTLQSYLLQFLWGGDDYHLVPRSRSTQARKYFWGRKQGFSFRREAFQRELLKPVEALQTQNPSQTPGQAQATPTPESTQQSMVAERVVTEPVEISVQIDPSLYSDEACLLLRDSFVPATSPWGISLGKVTSCGAIQPAPGNSRNAHFWRLYVAARENSAQVALCRPLTQMGSEECYGRFKLAPLEKVQAALKQPEFVTLLSAGLMEASPITALMPNGRADARRDNRLPIALASPPGLAPVRFGYSRGGLRLNLNRTPRSSNMGAHFRSLSPANSSRAVQFQKTMSESLEKLSSGAVVAQVIVTPLPTVPPTPVPTPVPTKTATPLPTPPPTPVPTQIPSPLPTPVPTQVPVPLPAALPTPLPNPVVPRAPTHPVPQPTQPVSPVSVPRPVPVPVPVTVPVPNPSVVQKNTAQQPPAPAVVPTPKASTTATAAAAGHIDFGHSRAAGLVLHLAGLPVPQANQKNYSSNLSYGLDARLWSNESTRFGLRAMRSRHAYSLAYTPDAAPTSDPIDSTTTDTSAEKYATAVRYENAIGLSFHQSAVIAQRRLHLELYGGEVSYTTSWTYDRTATSKIFPALSNAAYNYGGRLMWIPWLENSGDVFGVEAEWQKGSTLTGRVLALQLGWRIAEHSDDNPRSIPDYLLDLYGKVQVGQYKTPNPSSGVMEDIRTNTIMFGTTLSFM